VQKKTEILNKANEIGMKTMAQDAAIKVINGQTTISEMLRVTFVSE
jgi:hypothetical protein